MIGQLCLGAIAVSVTIAIVATLAVATLALVGGAAVEARKFIREWRAADSSSSPQA